MSDRKEEQPPTPVSNDPSLASLAIDDDSSSQYQSDPYYLSLDERNRALYRWTRDSIETNNPYLPMENYFKNLKDPESSQQKDASQEKPIDLDEDTNSTTSQEELIDLDEAINITSSEEELIDRDETTSTTPSQEKLIDLDEAMNILQRQQYLVPSNTTVTEAFFTSGLEYTSNDALTSYDNIAYLIDSLQPDLPSPLLTVLTHEVDIQAYRRSLEPKKLSYPLFEDDPIETIAPHTACARCQHNPVNNSQGLTLLTCENCLSVQYCSIGCQDADWGVHQVMYCVKPSSIPIDQLLEPHIPSFLRTSLPNPFARLSKGLWLHDRHKIDVYALLIDSFRLREADDYWYAGLKKKESAFSGKESSVSPFRVYLNLAETKGLMPPWWSQKKRVECLDMGLDSSSDNFHDLRAMTRDIEVLVIYESAIMLMQLRMFAESVLGTGPARTNGQLMLQKMVMEEEASRSAAAKM
ncbi:hypothetical protein MKX08_001224 [Trichoderma sp. CBMAI-0020]|nr:hypothetical protein MKX08_001224 [Trichoderma sp. CBMAI-0020]